MTSTVLHGLDDAHIPEAFGEELDRAAWLECRPDAATLLNALLLAGWTPPSKQRESWAPVRDYCGRGVCAMLDGHEGECRV